MLVRIAVASLLVTTFATAASASAQEMPGDAAMLPSRVEPEAAAEPQIDPEVESLANDVGLEPIKLQGAVNSTKARPRAYLISEGLIQPPAPPPLTVSGIWAALAQCESGGNPRTNTGNGYFGMFQEDRAFWANYGNQAYARPDLAPPHEQLAAAQRGLARQGPGAWPVCGRRVGLTR